MTRFSVTFEIVTPESAEQGEAEDMGFISQDVSLREAFEDMGRTATYDCGRWLSNDEYNENYQTGAKESRAIHFPANITESSYRRLCRLFEVSRND